MQLIPIYPPEIVNNPSIQALMAKQGVQSPVTVQHTLISCPRCQRDGWIGPKQRELAKAGRGEVICVLCLFTSPDLVNVSFNIVGLNPDINDVPRRNG